MPKINVPICTGSKPHFSAVEIRPTVRLITYKIWTYFTRDQSDNGPNSYCSEVHSKSQYLWLLLF